MQSDHVYQFNMTPIGHNANANVQCSTLIPTASHTHLDSNLVTKRVLVLDEYTMQTDVQHTDLQLLVTLEALQSCGVVISSWWCCRGM